MPLARRAFVLAGLMGAASLAAVLARPRARIADAGPPVVLAALVPKRFGTWRDEPQAVAQVVNPQTQALLDKLYSQILTRTYVNGRGYRIMLSVAYGGDQREGLRAHKPEVCYPAQGFTLGHTEPVVLATPYGGIAARRMLAVLGNRHEPVTYWHTIGNRAVDGSLEEKLAEMKFGLTGRIPDGLLFRISSIDPDEARAGRMQEDFVRQLLAAVPPADRLRLAGLGTQR